MTTLIKQLTVVVLILGGAARGELTLPQDLAPDPYFQPIADKSFPLMPPVI